jgi:hypothetical protein
MGRGNRIKAAAERREARPANWSWALRRERPARKRHPIPNKIRDSDPIVTAELVWQPWNGEYEKDFYWIRNVGGERAVKCWPNAGFMNAADGTGRMWAPSPDYEVALVIGDSMLERGQR